MLDSKKERSITEGIISLAHGLGISVIAEGVELEDQALLLNEIGCEFIQGYFVSPPLWPNEFTKYMQENQLKI